MHLSCSTVLVYILLFSFYRSSDTLNQLLNVSYWLKWKLAWFTPPPLYNLNKKLILMGFFFLSNWSHSFVPFQHWELWISVFSLTDAPCPPRAVSSQFLGFVLWYNYSHRHELFLVFWGFFFGFFGFLFWCFLVRVILK